MRFKSLFALCIGLALVVAACDTSGVSQEPADAAKSLRLTIDQEASLASKRGGNAVTDSDPVAALRAQLDAVNAQLDTSGEAYRIFSIDWIAGPGSDQAGTTILQKDLGNKQLSMDFVPGDERRPWGGPDGAVTYAIDQTGDAVPFSADIPQLPQLTGADTDAAIEAAMATWDEQTCSDLSLTRNDDFGIDIGIIAFQNGLGGSPFVVADVQHAGFRDINFAGGVLGATFSFGFCDPCSGDDFAWTDINEDGKIDKAFAEIYYDPSWIWDLSDDGAIDVESIALHETGHGLAQAHFGNIMLNNAGEFVARPRAVMNAFYQDAQRELYGTDIGGHCSIWDEWPVN